MWPPFSRERARLAGRLFPMLCVLWLCRTLVPELVKELQKQGMEHVLVVAGGIIPPQVGPCGLEPPCPGAARR
jgi:hypothetical protein